MLLEKGSKFVFIGDSITDYERARPVGEGRGTDIGKSYVGIVDGMIAASDPSSRIRVINMGTSGNTVLDLKARWDTDVMDLHPDWLSIYIGINDVWRQFDTPLITEKHVSPKLFEETYRSLIERTLPTLKGLILVTPHFLELNREDPMRKRMDEYGAIVKKLAKEYGAILVDTQAAFDEFLTYYHPGFINWDRIHPNTMGHCIIAKAFLKALEVE